jgi:hypothetical protein
MQARVACFCPTSCLQVVIRPDSLWLALFLPCVEPAVNFITDIVTHSSVIAIIGNNYFTTRI